MTLSIALLITALSNLCIAILLLMAARERQQASSYVKEESRVSKWAASREREAARADAEFKAAFPGWKTPNESKGE